MVEQENIIFLSDLFDKHYDNHYSLIDFFEDSSKYKFENINELVTYLDTDNRFGNSIYPFIIKQVLEYSMKLNLENDNIKLNKPIVHSILRYCAQDDLLISNFILNSDKYIDYDDVCQFAIANGLYYIIDLIFDKIKLTQEQFNSIFSHIRTPEADRLLDKCISTGLFPTEDLIYNLINRGIIINKDVLAMYNINDNNNNIRYTIARIKTGSIDFKKEKNKRYNFNSNEKEQIKTVIFENIYHFTEKNLNSLALMYDLKYDDRCFTLFCRYSIDYKIFSYFVNLGIKPDYESLRRIVSKLHTCAQIKKFF